MMEIPFGSYFFNYTKIIAYDRCIIKELHCFYDFVLQVSWHLMQDEFIQQYKHFEDLIHRCYPGANVILDFKVQDLLQFFSEIAQSH